MSDLALVCPTPRVSPAHRIARQCQDSDAANAQLQPGEPLRGLRQIGYLVLGVKFLGFCVWSMVLYQHFALLSHTAVSLTQAGGRVDFIAPPRASGWSYGCARRAGRP